MRRLNIRRKKEKKLIWKRFRFYIDLAILACCGIVAWNINPYHNSQINESNNEKPSMLYIFHDYEWNHYILNETAHWAASSWEYLFNDNIPNEVKWEEKNDQNTGSVSLWDVSDNSNMVNEENQLGNIQIDSQSQENNNSESIKNNQISLAEIMNELWVDNNNENNYENNEIENEGNWISWSGNETLIINLWELKEEENSDEDYYQIEEYSGNNESSLVIEKIDQNKVANNWHKNSENWTMAKNFSFMTDWWILPTLIPWEELDFNIYSNPIGYVSNSEYIYADLNWNKKPWITILPDYEDCMTPWWYKIVHGDSVLAYQQMDNAPDICNIERRFCRKWKLSWTYTQQWCFINKSYTYAQWWEANPTPKTEEIKSDTTQNSDWTVTVNKPLWTGSFVFDKPSQSSTPSYNNTNNIKKDNEVDQTTRPHRNCTTPRWEKVLHGQIIQAFKHSNWFSDSPCEAQIRLCSMWKLKWSYTESSCKTWDTSFIDWINGSPTWKTYSKEKLKRVKNQIKNENVYDKDYKKITNVDALERILRLLDD